MDEYRMARRVLMAELSGGWVQTLTNYVSVYFY